ncbi:MAG: hypothetical protein F2518_00085 [Actinobacteria bacterium]|nr:hypothetical protein [Actinomycetota bacterium]
MPMPKPAARHVDRCLRCQAEQAQYKKVFRNMGGLRSAQIDPGPNMLSDILDYVQSQGSRNPILMALDRHRVVYVAAATATAAVATAAGAIVIAGRVRRPASA